MRVRPANTLNHREHDLLVELAVGALHWRDALEAVGYERTNTGTIYKMMAMLLVPPTGNLDVNVKALVEEARRRDYQHSIQYLMYDDEPEWQTIEELGEVPAHYVAILPRQS